MTRPSLAEVRGWLNLLVWAYTVVGVGWLLVAVFTGGGLSDGEIRGFSVAFLVWWALVGVGFLLGAGGPRRRRR